MATQLVTTITALLPIYVALFAIAIGVLRLYQPRMVTATVTAAPMIHVPKDVIYIDTNEPHHESIEHSVTSNKRWYLRYHFTERNKNMVTYVRDEYHGPSAW